MRAHAALLLLALILPGCPAKQPHRSAPELTAMQQSLNNETTRSHPFLAEMYADGYFPNHLVDRCKAVLVKLCRAIEEQKPESDAAFLRLTHAAVERINDLEEAFAEEDSELETGAREALGADFALITRAYGFKIDIEEVIAPREW